MGRKPRTDDWHFDGFAAPTTTPVPDIIFDEFLARLGEAELKALLYIVRRTFGFKKASDPISFNQFLRGIVTLDGRVLDSGCGVRDRTTLSRALQSLEAKGIIHSEKGIDQRGENETTVYSLQFAKTPALPTDPGGGREFLPPRYESPTPPAEGVVGNSYYPGMNHPQGVVGIPYHGWYEFPTTVVGNSYPQETVKQETEGIKNSNERFSIFCGQPVDNDRDNSNDTVPRPIETIIAPSAPIGPDAFQPTPLPTSSMPAILPAPDIGETAAPPPATPTQQCDMSQNDGDDENDGDSEQDEQDDGWFAAPVVHVQLLRFATDFGREFHDRAPPRVTARRLCNLYRRARMPLDAFTDHCYHARETTRGRAASIRTRADDGTAHKMPYFFAVLEDSLGLRPAVSAADPVRLASFRAGDAGRRGVG